MSLEPGALAFGGDEAAEVGVTHKDLLAQAEAVPGSTASFESVKRCSGLAKAASDNATRTLEVCKRLVEDQHLLNQVSIMMMMMVKRMTTMMTMMMMTLMMMVMMMMMAMMRLMKMTMMMVMMTPIMMTMMMVAGLEHAGGEPGGRRAEL